MRSSLVSPWLVAALALTGACKKEEDTDTGETDTEETDTVEPSTWEHCPAWTFTAPATGTYTIVVSSAVTATDGACPTSAQDTWDYKLDVSGADGGSLTEGQSDAEHYIPHDVVDNAVGELTFVDDTDADTDLDDGFTGEVTYQRTLDDALVCDVDVALLSAEAYVGTCAGCTFGFKVDATTTREDSTDGCIEDRTYAYLSFQEGPVPGSQYQGTLSEPWIAYAAYGWNAGAIYGTYQMHTEAVAFGWTYDYVDNYTNYTYPSLRYYGNQYQYQNFNTTPYEYGEYVPTAHTVTLGDTQFTWDLVFESTFLEPVFGASCVAAAGAEGGAAAGGQSATGDLPCDEDLVDEWTFTATAGQTIAISVDTTSADAFGDGQIEILDPNGCTVGKSDDAFACLYGVAE